MLTPYGRPPLDAQLLTIDNVAVLLAAFRAIVLAASSAAIAAAQLNLPNKTYWPGRTYLLYASLVALAYLVIAEAVRVSLPSIQARKVREYEQNIRSALNAGVKEVVNKFPVDWEDVGVHAFLARGLPPFRRLVNVGGIRLSAKPSMTRPVWHPGKGVVGQAFRLQTPHAENWEAYFQNANSAGRSTWNHHAKWYQLPFPAWGRPFGLSWGELQLTADYKGIVAKPIFASGGKLVGCVVVDAPLSVQDLTGAAMQDILRDVAGAVVLAGVPPRAWLSYKI